MEDAMLPDQQWKDRLFNEGVKPHKEAIAEIAARGDIAIVVFEPDASIVPAIRAVGWDGQAPVFRMSNGHRKRVAANSDAVTARWLLRRDSPQVARVLVFTERANFLVNATPGRGWSFEPGSLDSERV